jgi:hypothetical protein
MRRFKESLHTTETERTEAMVVFEARKRLDNNLQRAGSEGFDVIKRTISKFQENQEFLESFPIEFNDWKLGGMTYHDGGFTEYGNAGITIRSIKPLKKHLNKFVDRFNDEALFDLRDVTIHFKLTSDANGWKFSIESDCNDNRIPKEILFTDIYTDHPWVQIKTWIKSFDLMEVLHHYFL